MKKPFPFQYSVQFSFIDIFSYKRITIPDTLLSKINTDLSCNFRADSSDGTLLTKTFNQHKLAHLWVKVNRLTPLKEKCNYSQSITLKPIQEFTVTDFACGVFLPFTFTSYKTKSSVNNFISSYLN